MKMLKRWTASITASFDHLINQVENHEAVVNCAIREMKDAGGKARAQLIRVKRDGESMRRRIYEIGEMTKLWEERAVRCAGDDRDRAIECLRRKKNLEKEILSLQQQEKEHSRLAAQLETDISQIHCRTEDLKRKKNAFIARQYRSEALRISHIDELGAIAELDEIFERWEDRLNQCESFQFDVDSLEESFLTEEEEEALNGDLETLLSTQATQDAET